MARKWIANGVIVRNGTTIERMNVPKANRWCQCTARCFGIPCTVVIFFILFTIFYSPETYKRSMNILPLVNGVNAVKAFKSPLVGEQLDSVKITNFKSTFQNAFPEIVQKWIYQCNKISSLSLLEPETLSCLYGVSFESCLNSQILSIYRFAFMTKDGDDKELVLRKIASCSYEIGWNITNETFHTSLSMNNGNTKIFLSILERRLRYLYVHGTTNFDTVQEPRAFLGINFIPFQLTNNDYGHILTPAPLDVYLWQWSRSSFLECNSTSAEYMRKRHPAIYDKPSRIKEKFLDSLAYCRDLMLRRRMTPLLAGGTALGWYRECGIIPYTTDIDIMFPAIEWNSIIETDLKTDKLLSLYWILGKPSDSLEISVYARSVKIDIFAIYQESNKSWIGGMIVPEKAKLRWWYPRLDQICTADLKGHLFYVPCDIVAYLTADYGPMWYEPHHNNQFIWYKSHNNVQRNGHWNLSEWTSVYRTFHFF